MCMDPKPKNPKENKVTVLGLGGSGGQILRHIAKQCDNYNLLYVDSDETSLLESTVKTLQNTSNGQTDFVSVMEEIRDTQKLIITTGLGGEFGTFSSYIIYKMAKTENIQDIELVITIPAKFEGKKRINLAQETLELLNTNNVDYTIIHFDNLIEKMDKKASLNDCFKIMDEIVYQKIISLVI